MRQLLIPLRESFTVDLRGRNMVSTTGRKSQSLGIKCGTEGEICHICRNALLHIKDKTAISN